MTLSTQGHPSGHARTGSMQRIYLARASLWPRQPVEGGAVEQAGSPCCLEHCSPLVRLGDRQKIGGKPRVKHLGTNGLQ